jgi:hypothetical protein
LPSITGIGGYKPGTAHSFWAHAALAASSKSRSVGRSPDIDDGPGGEACAARPASSDESARVDSEAPAPSGERLGRTGIALTGGGVHSLEEPHPAPERTAIDAAASVHLGESRNETEAREIPV